MSNSAIDIKNLNGGHNLLLNRDVAGNHAKLIPVADGISAIQVTKADGLTPSTTFDTVNDAVNTSIIDLRSGLPNPSHKEARFYYDQENYCMSYYTERPDLEVHIGQEIYVRVKNETGSLISRGRVVYPSGITLTGDVSIGLANASDKSKCRLIGVTAHDIPDGECGYVAKFGLVHDINTSMYSNGDTLYLSTVDGLITNIKPTGGAFITQIGAIKKIDATSGSIVVDINTSEMSVEALQTCGWSPSNLATLAFNRLNRTLTINPISSSMVFYQYGDKYTKGVDSIIMSNDEGNHLIYYNLGVLQDALNPTPQFIDTVIKNNPTVAYIYWNADDQKEEYIGYELHKIGINSNTHAYLHFALRCRYITGLTPTDVIADGSGASNASAQFGITSGLIADEDITHATPTIPYTTGFPIAYLLGPDSNPKFRTTTNPGYPVITTGSGRLAYNHISAGDWVLSEVDDGNFVCCHILALNSNDINQRVGAFIGQSQYDTIADARTGAETEIATLRSISILPQEAKAIATFILETSNTFTNAVKGRIRTIDTNVTFVDLRNAQISGSSGTGGVAPSMIFPDSQFKLYNGTDATKNAIIDLSAINPSTTRVISVPNRNLILDHITTNTSTSLSSGAIPYSTGTTIASSSSLLFDSTNLAIAVPKIKPISDSTSALQITKANGTTSVVVIDTTNSRIGIDTSPSAKLTLPAGTAIAGTAPLKLTSGVNLTSPEAGAIEYNGANLFITDTGSVRQKTNLSAYGYMSELTTGGTTITIVTAGTYYGWVNATARSNFLTSFTDNATADRLTVLPGGDGDYFISFDMGGGGLGGGGTTFDAILYKNETPTTIRSYSGTSSNIMDVDSVGIISLASGDYVSLRVTCGANNRVWTYRYANISMTRISRG